MSVTSAMPLKLESAALWDVPLFTIVATSHAVVSAATLVGGPSVGSIAASLGGAPSNGVAPSFVPESPPPAPVPSFVRSSKPKTSPS